MGRRTPPLLVIGPSCLHGYEVGAIRLAGRLCPLKGGYADPPSPYAKEVGKLGAVMLLAVIILVCVDMAFTVRIWREMPRESFRSKREIKVPKGKKRQGAKQMEENQSLQDLINQTIEQMNLNAEESGEDEIEVSAQDVEAATKAVLSQMGAK